MGLGLSGMGHSLGPHDWVGSNGAHVGRNDLFSSLFSLVLFPPYSATPIHTAEWLVHIGSHLIFKTLTST